MLGLNYLAWIGIVSWIVVPLLALLATVLLWRRSRAVLSTGMALAVGFAILSVPTLVSKAIKAHYDGQVRELCAKDGGVRVYETVRLPAEKFDQLGQIRIPSKQDAKPGDEYYDEWREQSFREGNPSIRRDHFLVYRRSDMKLLGEAVSYARLGGDLPGPWHGSSFRCPEDSGNSVLQQRILIQSKGEE
jgi:hypothetical protein